MGRELQWKKYRGGTDVYGESIYTKRWELLVLMNFPLQKKCCFHFLIRTTTKTPFMVICHTSPTHWLWAIDLG
jgi:hypothetical protein